MKSKKIKISINCQLDYVQVEVTMPDGRVLADKRWPCPNSSPNRDVAILEAKGQCFDLLWQYTEMGDAAYIHPYLN